MGQRAFSRPREPGNAPAGLRSAPVHRRRSGLYDLFDQSHNLRAGAGRRAQRRDGLRDRRRSLESERGPHVRRGYRISLAERRRDVVLRLRASSRSDARLRPAGAGRCVRGRLRGRLQVDRRRAELGSREHRPPAQSRPGASRPARRRRSPPCRHGGGRLSHDGRGSQLGCPRNGRPGGCPLTRARSGLDRRVGRRGRRCLSIHRRRCELDARGERHRARASRSSIPRWRRRSSRATRPGSSSPRTAGRHGRRSAGDSRPPTFSLSRRIRAGRRSTRGARPESSRASTAARPGRRPLLV